jgi:DNA-binding winged helix-turn-helix (wHTH) protein/tetratricopeptide (TPR) repeat protein
MPVNSSSKAVIRFGVFEADLRSGELRKDGVKIKVQELPFQALKLLVSRPNEVLSREEIRQTLWPDGVYVDFDRGVISAINRLRDALGDSAENPVFIETVGRRGYRWIAPTHSSDPSPAVPISPSINRGVGQSSVATPKTSRGWKFLFVLPIVVLLFLLGVYWQKHKSFINRSFRANSAARIASSSHSTEAAPPHRPANAEAQEFYLKGRYYWEKRTPESLNRAVDAFTQAIVHDPAYAPAYVGLADCYNLLREYTLMPSSEAYPRALAAAKKAVELDPQSSEAHASLAFVSFWGMWDTTTAEREFHRALELNPNNAIAHHWYATYLECLRHYPESLSEIDRSQVLDPASKSVLADKGSLLFGAGHPREAIALLKQMEEAEPDFISPHRYLKAIYLLTGDYPDYLAEAKKQAILMHDDSALGIWEATEKGFASGGGKSMLNALAMQQKKLCDRGQGSPYELAQTYSMLGNEEEALHYLRIAFEQHADNVPAMSSDHAFDNLHADPVFRQMVADAGLPPLN